MALARRNACGLGRRCVQWLPIFLAKETLLLSCVGIASHLETGGAPFAGSSAHWSDCFCPQCNCSCMEFDRCSSDHCHQLRWIFADDGSAHTAKITNHSPQLMCSFNPTDHENRKNALEKLRVSLSMILCSSVDCCSSYLAVTIFCNDLLTRSAPPCSVRWNLAPSVRTV